VARRLKKGPEKIGMHFFSKSMENTFYHAQLDEKMQKRQQESRGMI
jgi:hypothetical protein